MKRKKIPLHIDELDNVGLSLRPLIINETKGHLLKAHRDEYYVFLLQQKGSLQVMIDFSPVTLKNSGLLFIKPGQVHYYLPKKTVGWVLKISPTIIEAYLRDYLDNLPSQYVSVKDVHKLTSVLNLINSLSDSPKRSNFEVKELQSYVTAFVAIVCTSLNNKNEKNMKPQSKGNQIRTTFLRLLKDNFRTLKKPADYAKLLNISSSYLNETLIRTTGFSTSYCIQQELFLEAKRLLHHTELSAKEIAFNLGFEDHTYFARLFKKINGLTPIAFRKTYRNLSN